MIKCEMCKEKASVKISWFASIPQNACVCEWCAAMVWNRLSTQFSGTDAFMTFSIDTLSDP